ncbi:hypothetical protein MMEU_0912 [Mycobacterium marinum str. Europe]|nr:hypothetical protein MMEU_0912 [Mycobacterium marinum str. Europe]
MATSLVGVHLMHGDEPTVLWPRSKDGLPMSSLIVADPVAIA